MTGCPQQLCADDSTQVHADCTVSGAFARHLINLPVEIFVALFRLTLLDRADPVYLILAMTSEKTLRLKPQNLLTGLPGRP